MKKEDHSKNPVAEQVVGLRPKGYSDVCCPSELGYVCPACHPQKFGPHAAITMYVDEDLCWSEYNGFLWCKKCNIDYPSALCMPDLKQAIDTYLKCVEEAKLGKDLKKRLLGEESEWFREEMEAGR